MPAFYEELHPGIGLIRVGPRAFQMGDPWQHQIVAQHKNGEPVELKGYYGRASRIERDAIALCLLRQGFANWQMERYKKGVKIPPHSRPIRFSETYLKEVKVTVKTAFANATQKIQHAIDKANKHGNTDLATRLQAVHDAHIASEPVADGSNGGDFTARFDALRPLVVATNDLAVWGMAQPNQDTEDHIAAKQAVQAMKSVAVHVLNDIEAMMKLPPAP